MFGYPRQENRSGFFIRHQHENASGNIGVNINGSSFDNDNKVTETSIWHFQCFFKGWKLLRARHIVQFSLDSNQLKLTVITAKLKKKKEKKCFLPGSVKKRVRGASCVSLTPNNTKTIERMTCHCFLWPIRRNHTSSSYSTNRPFPSSPGPLFQNEGRCSAFDMEIIFRSHANRTHFHKKGWAPSLILKVRVFGTRKWPIVIADLFYYCQLNASFTN